MSSFNRSESRYKRQRRVRKKIKGTNEQPRLCVFRSLKHIYAQLIDDTTGSTVASVSSLSKDVSAKLEGPGCNKKASAAVGKAIADLAAIKGIKKVVFDRNGFLYHGRVKALSDAAREAGLQF